MRQLVVVSTLVAMSASAEPGPQVRELLAKGQAAEARGKHDDAALALEAALKLAPDEPAVLAELGWVDFARNDLKTAEELTRHAVQLLPLVADDPFRTSNSLRGAALYNLGQILERRGDQPGAIAAYSDSLKARPNGIVAAQLRKLDAAAADVVDPLAPTPMQGPFASIEAYCKSVAAPGGADGGAAEDCRCGQLLAREGRTQLAPGFDKIVAFPRRGCADHADQELDLAVKHGDAWYVAAVGTGTENDGTLHCTDAEWRDRGVTFEPLTGESSIARVEYTSKGSCSHRDSEWGWETRSVVAIGVGPSGKPSATPAIPIAYYDTDGEHSRKPVVIDTLTWTKDSSVAITGTLANNAVLFGGDPRGTHHLVFR